MDHPRSFFLTFLTCSMLAACGTGSQNPTPDPNNPGFNQATADAIASATMKATRFYFASRAIVGASPASQLNPATAINTVVNCADPTQHLNCTGSYTVNSVGNIGVGYTQRISYANFDGGGVSYTNPDNSKVVVKTSFNGTLDFLVLRYVSESDYRVSFTYNLVFDQSYVGTGPIQGSASCEQTGFFDVPACQFEFPDFQLKYKYSAGGGFNKAFTATTSVAGIAGQSIFQFNSWGWNTANTLGSSSLVSMTAADGSTATINGSTTKTVTVKRTTGGQSSELNSTIQ